MVIRHDLTALFLALGLLKIAYLGSGLAGSFGEIEQVVTAKVAAVLPLSVAKLSSRGYSRRMSAKTIS
jgi:hypothetical protein